MRRILLAAVLGGAAGAPWEGEAWPSLDSIANARRLYRTGETGVPECWLATTLLDDCPDEWPAPEYTMAHDEGEYWYPAESHTLTYKMEAPSVNVLEDANGDWVPMLVLNDGAPGSANQNCEIDAGEETHVLPAVDGIRWGATNAGSTKAPGDATAISSSSGSSFATPAGTGTTWVAFMPDGRPVGMSAACTFGQLGSGTGGIYITNGERDYAVVLHALGAVRLHAWAGASGGWQG